jgi:hypothetical protein
MPDPNAVPLFRCKSCFALYQVVKAQAGPETVEPRFQKQMGNLFDPSIQNTMRQLAQPSSGLSALREQVRRLAEPPSGLLGLHEQMRKFVEPSPGMLALRNKCASFWSKHPTCTFFRSNLVNLPNHHRPLSRSNNR